MYDISIHKEQTFSGHKDAVYSLIPSNDPDSFISAGGDGMVVAWEMNDNPDGSLIARLPNTIYAMDILPEIGLLAVGQNYEGIHFIDINSRKEAGSLKIGDT